MKTYFIFYITQDDLGRISSMIAHPESCGIIFDLESELHQRYVVYAVTQSKKYAKMFRKTRDMRFFIENKITLDDQEAFDFEYKYSGNIIETHALTAILDGGDEFKRGSMVFPMPCFEFDSINMWGISIIIDNLINLSEETDLSIFMKLPMHDVDDIVENLIDEPDANLDPIQIFTKETQKMFYELNLDVFSMCFSIAMNDVDGEGFECLYTDWQYSDNMNEYMLYIDTFKNLFTEEGLYLLRSKYSKFILNNRKEDKKI